jgi:hypothetical protein
MPGSGRRHFALGPGAPEYDGSESELPGLSVIDRLKNIRSYELLIFFILLVLLGLCLFATQAVLGEDGSGNRLSSQSLSDAFNFAR